MWTEAIPTWTEQYNKYFKVNRYPMKEAHLKKFCFALDLKDDAEAINTYQEYHKAVWPEINQSLKDSGIVNAEIYNTGNRLFMIIEAAPDFSIAQKSQKDQNNPRVQAWETLMWEFQQALPHAPQGTKWVLMEKIYDLNDQVSSPTPKSDKSDAKK